MAQLADLGTDLVGALVDGGLELVEGVVDLLAVAVDDVREILLTTRLPTSPQSSGPARASTGGTTAVKSQRGPGPGFPDDSLAAQVGHGKSRYRKSHPWHAHGTWLNQVRPNMASDLEKP